MIHWQPGVTISDVEKQVIVKAYNFYKQNKTQTAQALGISVRTLDKRLDDYGLPRGNKKEEIETILPAGAEKLS